jgi:hypothetical protein
MARIAAELEDRRQEAERENSLPERKFLEAHDTPNGSYQWEMVDCGHKDRCKRCKRGLKHGPYLYRYYYHDGRRRSEYIKLQDAARLGFSRPSAPRDESQED